MIGYSSHSAGCALTQSIPSAPAVCNHRSSYRQTHLKRYVGFTFSCRLPIDNIRFGQPETPMYLRPFLSHRTVPFRSTRSSRSAFHSVVADLGGKAENLLTDEAFRSCDCPQVLLCLQSAVCSCEPKIFFRSSPKISSNGAEQLLLYSSAKICLNYCGNLLDRITRPHKGRAIYSNS